MQRDGDPIRKSHGTRAFLVAAAALLAAGVPVVAGRLAGTSGHPARALPPRARAISAGEAGAARTAASPHAPGGGRAAQAGSDETARRAPAGQPATAASRSPAGASAGAGAASSVDGMPAGVPPAALETPPALPEPPATEWPFPAGAFPHTEGAARLAGGADYWTGFLYGDHGAKGIPASAPVAAFAPTVGTYVYPAGPADGNDANIFGAAVGLAPSSTWWRVDWTTLVDPRVPIAEWALDTGHGPATSTWPAGAGVSSPAERAFLLVSVRGAWLIDAAGHARSVASLGGTLSVDRAAKAFVVRIPRRALPVGGDWQVRLVAGLANTAGNGFAAVTPADGARPGQPAVYDVGFRTYQQERPRLIAYAGPDPAGLASAGSALASGAGLVADDNFWTDGAQATALAAGTVAPFSLRLDWGALAARETTPEPQPTGWTDRWYVSSLDLGQGVSANPGDQLSPNYLGQVQPYGVYVPKTYRPGRPAPLTFLLHSLDVNLNQYAVLDPRFVAAACERRGSICVTPESRGAGGWYQGPSQVDFWQVWHAVAGAYDLATDRTVIAGYSMGGYGTYEIGLQYPDLFATAVSLSGPPTCGIRLATGADVPAGTGTGVCQSDGETAPLVGNARWLPFVIEQGVADELVPVAGVVQQVQLFDQAGERYLFELYPAEDHLVNATQDGFGSEAAAMGQRTVVRDPPSFGFTWFPAAADRQLGLGPSGDYWIQGLRGVGGAGATATVTARSLALPQSRVSVARTTSADPTASPTPAVVRRLSWVLRPAPPTRPVLDLRFTNVAAATVDLAGAGFAAGEAGTASVCTSTRILLTLAGEGRTELAPGCHDLRFG